MLEMNTVKAAALILEVVNNKGIWPMEPIELSRGKVRLMLEKVTHGLVNDEEAQRRIGFAQAACLRAEATTADRLEKIIRNCGEEFLA